MTECEWRECTHPARMLVFMRDKKSERKLRLFASACCRRIWALLKDERSRKAVEITERFGEGLASGEELTAAYYAANVATLATDPLDKCYYLAASLACDVAYALPFPGCSCTPAAATAVADTVADPTMNVRAYKLAEAEEIAVQCRLFRDIFGNPLHPVSIPPAWLTPTVTSLAQAAYEERILPSGELDPDRLAVVADALEEEAGCDNADILSHLRSPVPHVRGCWVVDLLLGKV